MAPASKVRGKPPAKIICALQYAVAASVLANKETTARDAISGGRELMTPLIASDAATAADAWLDATGT